jgi:hypothetical protein
MTGNHAVEIELALPHQVRKLYQDEIALIRA